MVVRGLLFRRRFRR